MNPSFARADLVRFQNRRYSPDEKRLISFGTKYCRSFVRADGLPPLGCVFSAGLLVFCLYKEFPEANGSF